MTAIVSGGPASGAELLKDINPLPSAFGSYVDKVYLRLGAETLLLVNDGVHGSELWSSDGTSQGTALVKDINPGPAGSGIRYLMPWAAGALFWADDGTNGMELWFTDGSTAGTHIVANIDGTPDQSASVATYGPLPQLGGAVFFAAQNAETGTELWRSDGTNSGTWRVVDINPGSASSYPEDIVVLGTHLFFVADDGTHGREVWVTDGTRSGTHIVDDIASGALSSAPAELTATGAGLFFRADDYSAGPELWLADPAGAGARLVKNFIAGAYGSYPSSLRAAGNGLIYCGLAKGGIASGVMTELGNCSMFVSNGTAAGTLLLSTSHPELENVQLDQSFASVGNRTIFRLTNLPSKALWSSDGTVAGTAPLTALPLDFATGNSDAMTNVGNWLYFYAHGDSSDSPVDLWRTDGTTAGTEIFAALPQPMPGLELAGAGDHLYFAAGNCCTDSGVELWTSDGTAAGTVMVKDINPGMSSSSPTGLYMEGSTLHFFANDGVHGPEPWISDGTAAGTRALGDFNPKVVTPDSAPQFMATLNGVELFSADDGVHGRELWVSDGTSAGTQLVLDLRPGTASFQASSPALVMNGVAYFAGDDGTHGVELWRSDGSASGTYLLADLYPGNAPPIVCAPFSYCPPKDPVPASSAPWVTADLAYVMNGYFYFSADDGVHGRELWRSDGTTVGTTLVATPTDGTTGSVINLLGTSGNRVYFCAGSSGSAVYPWATDGTAAGTTILGSGLQCDNTNGISNGRVIQNVFYFGGRTDAAGSELWRSDGTVGGTYEVADLAPGSNSSSPSFFRSVNGRLTFSACTTQTACSFYVSDGTAAGTRDVPGVPIPVIAQPRTLAAGLIYEGLITGSTLGVYISDGTVAGTRAWLPSAPFPNGIHLDEATDYLGTVMFGATNGVHGSELWTSNGTSAGTHAVFDPQPASNDDNIFFNMVVLGNTLLFTADEGVHGMELWSLPAGAPTANPDAVQDGYGHTVALDVVANDGYIATALNPSSITIVTPPTHGTAIVQSAGTVDYTPVSGYSGQDQFVYTVNDLNGRTSNPAVAEILVDAPAGGAGGAAPADTGSGSSSGGSSGSGGSGSGTKGGGGGLGIFEVLTLGLTTLCVVRRRWLRNRCAQPAPRLFHL